LAAILSKQAIVPIMVNAGSFLVASACRSSTKLGREISTRRLASDGNSRRAAVRLVSSSPTRPVADSETSDFEWNVPIVQERSALRYGCIDYTRGWAWQHFILNRRLVARRQNQGGEEARLDNEPDTVLLFEHNPVYTLGRGADENHLTFLQEGRHHETRERLSRRSRGVGSARLAVDSTSLGDVFGRPDHEVVDSLCEMASPVLAPNGAKIFRVDRGGEVTFHGPGQLVVYPLFDLQREPFRKDLHWYLRMVEEVILRSLEHYGIEAVRDDINTGVWVGHDKVAAVGVSSSRWITTHGFALNVCPDLSYFDTSVILPCGIDGRGVTSIAEILDKRGESSGPAVHEVGNVVLENIRKVFQIEIESAEPLR
jgi:lipoyl(octanoyl) transferase